jgi:probable phosphoglycerate mutase
MTRIYLIRHAEAEGNLYRIAQGHTDGRLTKRGWEQVKALEHRFESIHVDAVYASDLYRTRATASAIYKPKGLPLHQDPALREANLGVWEGMPWGEISRLDGEQLVNFSIRTHLWRVAEGETAAQVQQRLEEAVRRIGRKHDGQTIAIASHGFAIRMLLGKLQGYPLEKIGESPQEDNTAVSLLELDGQELRVVFRSDNSHLFSLTEKTIARKRPSALEHGMYYCQPVLPQQEEILEKMADAARKETGTIGAQEEMCHTLFGFNGQEAPSALLQMRSVGQIGMLYVLPEERQQGLGVQLIGQAVQWTLANGGQTLCIVLEEQSPAWALFAENEFLPVKKTPEGLVILEKDLRCTSDV